MRQTHVAGERLFVDFAGQTVPITDPITGTVRPAQIFVAAFGASNYTYAEARWSQGLADWIGCHVNGLGFFGGVPRQIVCDNLKAGVTAASRYEPGINRTYQEMAAHYGTAIVPTRVRKPRDKAKVEVAVQVVERWVLAKLRHRRFFSLGEVNAAIGELIDELNSRTMRRIGSSRRALFETIERSALQPLPPEPFEYAEWKRCRAGLDYHIEVHGHWYSVPYRLIREVVEARIGDRTVEVFHHGVRVAVHVRSSLRHRHTTMPDHIPSAHRRYADWTPAKATARGHADRRSHRSPVELILAAKPHPEQGFRTCLGILRLVRSYSAERVEAACQRGIDIGARTYGSVVSILRNNLDRAYRPQPVPDVPPVQHGNIRGGGYH
jgi:transposase